MSPRPPKYLFRLDENFPVPAGKFLKSLGHNVKHSVDTEAERGISDIKQLQLANKENRK